MKSTDSNCSNIAPCIPRPWAEENIHTKKNKKNQYAKGKTHPRSPHSNRREDRESPTCNTKPTSNQGTDTTQGQDPRKLKGGMRALGQA